MNSRHGDSDLLESVRSELQDDGASPEALQALDVLASLAPIQEWDIWSEAEGSKAEWLVRLKCPLCGEEANYHLDADAIFDFYCPDDQVCGFDMAERDDDSIVPLPGSR